ncbi:MAG: MaoC domain protein dehydratase [Rhodospirillales bacterium]|jgi:2-methylfumaryl-CoA hydratase|nr:MaoC domain protein dehydratase [Rhodospirillales bacterium]
MAGAQGRFFEDFRLGEEIRHATPRTVTEADRALTIALTGSRFPLHSADTFARALGLERAPLDDWLTFNIVFGKTVPDISLNAVANLGYAEGRFSGFVYPGDTLSARSTVIGLREASAGDSGIVYVRSEGLNQRGETVLSYVRWVLVQKRDAGAAAPSPQVPELPKAVPAGALEPTHLDLSGYDFELAGSVERFGDYPVGRRIAHPSGMTVEEACHMTATRLYQNTARVHFDQHRMATSRFKRRLVYGGHVISLARALSFDGLANACRILAINGGRHVAPCFAGDTVYAWSEVLDRAELGAHAGALRLRTVAVKNRESADFPDRGPDGAYDPSIILDLDYWALMPA